MKDVLLDKTLLNRLEKCIVAYQNVREEVLATKKKYLVFVKNKDGEEK